MFGKRYSRPFLIRSLYDLVRLVLPKPREYTQIEQGCFLLQEKLQVALSDVVRAMATSMTSKTWLDDKGDILWEKFPKTKKQRKVLQATQVLGVDLKETQIKDLAEKIASFLASPDKRVFWACNQIGLPLALLSVCSMWSTSPVELDYRGTVTVITDEVVQVRIGEGKLMDVSAAKDQLRTRLQLISWAAKILLHREQAALLGDIFSLTPQAETSMFDGNISFYHHKL